MPNPSHTVNHLPAGLPIKCRRKVATVEIKDIYTQISWTGKMSEMGLMRWSAAE
jgi:hypothetical protein